MTQEGGADELGFLRRVATALSALPEQRMRMAKLHEHLVSLEPDEAAWLLDGLATAGRAGGPPFDLALLAAVELANSERLEYEHRRAIFLSAERLQLEACKELFFSAKAGPGVDEDAAARPRALVPGGRPLTLGERKALARGWKRSSLELLLVDPHVDVISLLLDNPRMTEADILRLATARRATAQALQLIIEHRRWRVRPAIRRALLRNPRFAEASALRLVGLLNRSELRELRNDTLLPERVLHAIRRRLKPRD